MTEYLIVFKLFKHFRHSGAQLHDLNLSYGQLISVDCDEPLLEVQKRYRVLRFKIFTLGPKKKHGIIRLSAISTLTIMTCLKTQTEYVNVSIMRFKRCPYVHCIS